MKQKLLIFICAFFSVLSVARAQEKALTGKVTSEAGAPLSGVTVTVEGSASATQTDNYGNYRIVGELSKRLSFKLIGYIDHVIIINNLNHYNVRLEESSVDLDQVVVTGYGVQNKEAITGSVASISAQDIERRPVSSVTAVLEGAAPGLQINNSYGEPGSSPNVRVRGFGSINGSSTPTYVLDGVVFQGNISDLNPTDIESVSVLKDATSASLYGARGANGVIVITTKKGKAGSADLGLTVNQGIFARAIPEYEALNPQQYMGVAWQGYRNQLLTANPTWDVAQANQEATTNLIPSILRSNIFDVPNESLFDAQGNFNPDASIMGDYADDLDWFDAVSRKGHRQEYILNGRGGSEKGTYFFSLGYLDEQGYVKTSDFNRLTGRVNTQITPKSWMKAGLSVNASHQMLSNTTGSGSGFTNPWMFARNIAPIYPMHLHDPTTGAYLRDQTGGLIYDDGADTRNQYVGRHVVWENQLNANDTKRNTLNSQAFIDINLLKNLKFSVIGDINLRFDEGKTYNNAIIGDGSGNNGRASRTIYNYKNYTLQQQLNYTNSFGDGHNIDLFVGHENYGNIYTYLYGYKTTETFAGKHDLINFTDITSLTDYQYDDKLESYLSRARYNYQDKYFLEGSFRRDGSSRLHPDNRWGNFWSAGATWILSKENFLSNVYWVNSLKLRAATGVVGNISSLGFYDYMALYSLGQNDNRSAFIKSNNENTALTWEGSQSSSLALEGRVFNRLNFTVEYFDKRSKDLLFNVNLPLSTGSTDPAVGTATIWRNIGELVNRGLEVQFDVDIIRNEDWKWNFGMNATIIKNKIINLPDENKENGIISSPFKYMEGRSVYDFFLFQYAGVDMLNGQALYHANTEDYDPTAISGAWVPFQTEINGEMYTRNSAYAKREYSGSAIPNVMGAFNTSISYKNWSLYGLFTYSLGGKGLDYSYVDLMSVGATPAAGHLDLLQSWNGAPEGMTEGSMDRINPNAIPQINYTNSQYNNASTTTRFLVDNSYFVVRNITLGYQLPKSMISTINLSRININCSVENLAIFSARKGFSPQQSFGGTSSNQFVPARVVSFGINVGF